MPGIMSEGSYKEDRPRSAAGVSSMARIHAEHGGNNTGTSAGRKQPKSSQSVLRQLFHNSFFNYNLR
jgi:hypothetical protein